MLDQLIRRDLLDFLKEDVPFWDVSVTAVPDATVIAQIEAKQAGVVAGLGIVEILFDMFNIKADFKANDGEESHPTKVLALLEGSSRTLLQIERLCLNLLGRMSGIATSTRKIVKIAKNVNPEVKIAATRKTTPGFRLYEKLAVQIGGGDTHRFDLSDTVMLKDNHLSLFPDISDAMKAAREVTSLYKKIEIEVKDEKEALEAARAGADVVMLDNFSPAMIRKTITMIETEKLERPLLEASGNINPSNVAEYASTGISVISCGYITHSAQNLDISMKFKHH
ncbi:MAG: carboxylating nicotinate-nucleotide diphosphorylase [Candidatus Odinarchaeota archaeon]